MIQLEILSGKKAGTRWTARRFPFQIGRSTASALVLDDDGVWEQHAEFSLHPDKGVILTSSPQSFVAINGQKVQSAALRNGDLIEAGSIKLRFGLEAPRQGGLRARELLTWLALASLCLAQVALVYWLTD